MGTLDLNIDDEFLKDITEVMKKHNVHDMVVAFQFGDTFRNAYLTKAMIPHKFFVELSDEIDALVHEKVKQYNQ